MELAMGRKPRNLLNPASMNPEQLDNNEKTSAEILLNEQYQSSTLLVFRSMGGGV